MTLLVLSGPEVHGLLPPGACADTMRDALAARARSHLLAISAARPLTQIRVVQCFIKSSGSLC